MLHVALAFLFGSLWLHQLPTLNLPHLAAPLSVALLALALTFVSPESRRARLRLLILAFLCGFVWTALHAQWRLRDQVSAALEGVDVVVTGDVADLPQREAYGQRFVLRVIHSELALPARLELTWYQAAPVRAAERWRLQVRLKRPHGFANPGGMDYEALLFRRGLGATGYVRESALNQRLKPAQGSLLHWRARLTDAIASALPDAPMQGVVRGLAVGDQQAISHDAWQVFARTGTTHLMAISGFHIGMVALIGAWLGSRLVWLPAAQRWRVTRQDLAALFGLSAALGYGLLAGMSVPTQRTLIMLAVYFSARLWRRAVNPWHSFGLALWLVLVLDPFAPLAAGAWLSFGAVAVILLNQHGRIGKLPGWRNFLGVQGVVTVGLVPLLLAAFGNLSLLSPLVNLLAIPLFTAVITPLVLLGCALLTLEPVIGRWVLHGAEVLLEYSYAGLEWAAQLSWATWYVPAAPAWAMALLGLGTIVMVIPWLWSLRLCGLLASLPAMLYQPEAPDHGEYQLTVLDVGQGLAVVVRTARRTLVYDTGPVFQSGRDTGELVLLPYLRSLGIRGLDLLMLSHADADHVGGAGSVQTGLPVSQLLFGPSVTNQPGATCAAGQAWRWDGVEFAVLHPAPLHAIQSDNNSSCVLRISAAGGTSLLLGDIERAVERSLVAAGRITPTHIVVAAHHGSASSSTAELIAASAADRQWVAFSAGYRNRWGFPRTAVLQRWSSAQALTTAASGALTFAVRPAGITVSSYRQRQPHYWQTRTEPPALNTSPAVRSPGVVLFKTD